MADQKHFGDIDYNEIAARSQQLTLDVVGKMFGLQADRQAAAFTKNAVELDPVQAAAIRQNMHRESPIGAKPPE